MEIWKLITVNINRTTSTVFGMCWRTYLSIQNGIIFYAKRNFFDMVFDMPTNVGPAYGMYVDPTLYQRYMSNMSYVGATLRQPVGPTMSQRANLRWANVVCQRWANGVANLAQTELP